MTLSVAIRELRKEFATVGTGHGLGPVGDPDHLRMVLAMWELEAVNMEHRLFMLTKVEHVPLDGLLVTAIIPREADHV